MKLAEALLLRSDMKKKLASLRERVVANVIVQEGEKPSEDPAKLMKEAAAVLDELETLILKIDVANQSHKLPDGRTIAQLIAKRDKLIQHHSLLQAAIAGTRQDASRYSMSEIKRVVTVEVAKLQKQSDDLSKNIRDLNAKIQEANWQIEIG